jgi:bacillithiol synthase
MKIHKISYDAIPGLAERDKAYIAETPDLRPFYKYPVNLASFEQVMQDKMHDKTDRATLVRVLKSQYQGRTASAATLQNIENLKEEHAFTIVTAHQPSLFTGPLYYIYKIVSAINLVETLRRNYPGCKFVPVFITGGEDHDFAEVNHLHLFNKTLTWENEESGAVGLMKTSSLQPVLAQLKEVLGTSENATRIYDLIERTHTQHELFGDAVCDFVVELFKEQGLVVLNMYDAALKQLFKPIIKEEIFRQSSHPLVSKTIGQLAEAGYPAQATPREINFFYLREQLRERIVFEDGRYKVVNTGLEFIEKEMAEEIDRHPERFSPNVIMRPLFQELVLPNLAYIGGGGELAYWMERKAQFEHFGINFPMLIRRNSALWLDGGAAKRMRKLGLEPEDLWEGAEDLIKSYLHKNAASEFQLPAEKQQLESVFQTIAEKTKAVDASLVKTVWAEHAKVLKSLSGLETRLTRAEKQKHDNAVQQIRSLKEKLFPGNGLQERHDNFLPFYLRYGEEFLKVLLENIHPLEKKFVVVEDA